MFLKHYLQEEAGDGEGAGSPTPEQPPFNPTAFQASVMESVNKALNAFDRRSNKHFESLNASIAKLTPTPAAEGGETATPAVARQPQAQGQNAELAKLRDSMKQLEESSRRKDREVAITAAVANLEFNSPLSRKDFTSLVSSSVVQDSDGSIVGPQGQSVEDFIRSEYELRPALMPAKAVNGSGATSGTRPFGGRQIQLEDIKPGMSQSDRDATRSVLSKILLGN